MSKNGLFIVSVLLIVIVAVSVVLGIYIFYFGEYEISNNPEKWGPFGDFFGGVLNPILAFFSFVALLYTIHIQQKELELTRVELSNSVSAQKKTADFARCQNEISERQIIELEKSEKKNDIYKIISTIDKKTLTLLNSEVNSYKTRGLIELKRVFLTVRLSDASEKASVIKNCGDEISSLSLELKELFLLVDEFSIISGHQYLKKYYENIYGGIYDICRKLNDD
ncbi:hypothetical protein [Vibrio cholerae]|uniref:hypothetical protein n=1 Tax=Vibrio cholerae TaxID=666 RepID=UPI00070EC638|nr:hypothetical protein [Vibrio cholerae]PAR91420.1 hypothetical protein CGT83_03385 [Vibrio cholerae]